jgi:hypothetical protein
MDNLEIRSQNQEQYHSVQAIVHYIITQEFGKKISDASSSLMQKW